MVGKRKNVKRSGLGAKNSKNSTQASDSSEETHDDDGQEISKKVLKARTRNVRNARTAKKTKDVEDMKKMSEESSEPESPQVKISSRSLKRKAKEIEYEEEEEKQEASDLPKLTKKRATKRQKKESSKEEEEDEDEEKEPAKKSSKQSTASKKHSTKKEKENEQKEENENESTDKSSRISIDISKFHENDKKPKDISKIKTEDKDRDADFLNAPTIDEVMAQLKALPLVPAIIQDKSPRNIIFPRYLTTVSSILGELEIDIDEITLENLSLTGISTVEYNGGDLSVLQGSKLVRIAKVTPTSHKFGKFAVNDSTNFSQLWSELFQLKTRGFIELEMELEPNYPKPKQYTLRAKIFLTSKSVDLDLKKDLSNLNRIGPLYTLFNLLFQHQFLGMTRWDIERVIWIGYYKGYQDGCPLSYLPRDLIRVIITLCRETLEEVAKIFSLESLFESIRPSIASPQVQDPPGLTCCLRPFQRKALYWMLNREMNVCKNGSTELHPAWTEINLPRYGKAPAIRLYYHRPTGILTNTFFSTPPTKPGGLLCEEMGLGKTVEICSLIMAHKPDTIDNKTEFVELMKSLNYGTPTKKNANEDEVQEGKRRSSRIAKAELKKTVDVTSTQRSRDWQPTPVPISTTLIITPQSILYQWFEELRKHMPEMKVFYYKGMNELGQEPNTMQRSTTFSGVLPKLARSATGGLYFDPRQFADYDIVLTTYAVLQKDVKKHKTNHPTPLICVEWWRVVLDEAQMVSKSNSDTAHMAACLYAQHRWCCTGTPIGNALDDLYGLLDFMYHNPFSDKKLFSSALLNPYYERTLFGLQSMRKFLKQVLWRHTKNHVWDELKLPPCTESVIKLDLSEIEDLFYRHLYRDIVYRLDKDQSFSSDQVLQLRQACCHPQLVAHSADYLGTERISMEEIFNRLIMKTKRDYETSVRELALSLNKNGSLFANPDPYHETIFDEETQQDVPKCKNPPAKNIQKGISFFKNALQTLQNYENAHAVLLPSSFYSAMLSTVNALIQIDHKNYINYQPLFKKLSSRKDIKKANTLNAISNKIQIPGHSPEISGQSLIARTTSYVKEVEHRLNHLYKIANEREMKLNEVVQEEIPEASKEEGEDPMEVTDEKESKKEISEDTNKSMEQVNLDESLELIDPSIFQSNDICPICGEADMETSYKISCGHSYCDNCIFSILSQTKYPKCAICRKPFSEKDLTQQYSQHLETKFEGKKIEYGTKVSHLIKMLLSIRKKDPKEKSVIFSQWNKLLDLIEEALRDNHIPFARLTGSESERTTAIQSFQSDPKILVFLISLKWNSGLTLVCATNCFLMEPSLNPSVEEQAKNRIHRIGQTKPTSIYKFIMNNTIEENILKMQEKKRELESNSILEGQENILKHEDVLQIFDLEQ